MPKLSVSISKVLVEGLKFVILSANFLLNFSGVVMGSCSFDLSLCVESLSVFTPL